MLNPFGWLRIPTADAHCDIPCGIYDPISAKIAAQTVQKMVLRIQNLEPPAASAPTPGIPTPTPCLVTPR